MEAGGHRQDAFRVVATNAGFLVAIACDGAGSASHGRYGAAIAARMLSTRAQNWLEAHGALPAAEEVEIWVAAVRSMIASVAIAPLTVSDFATTLVMAISDGQSVLTAHIGDGVIVARLREESAFMALSWPDNGDYAATTYFLTDLVPRLRIGVTNGIAIDSLAVLTDGIERLALDFTDCVAHEGFFTAIFAPVAASSKCGCNRQLSRQLHAFLQSDGVTMRTDDDKTLILAALT